MMVLVSFPPAKSDQSVIELDLAIFIGLILVLQILC